MACRHGLEEDCEPCDARADYQSHVRKGERPCQSCGAWLGKEYPVDDCESCRLESGEVKWCSACENVTTDEKSGICAACGCEQCDGDVCRGCGQECGCDTHAEHDAAEKLAMLDFLNDPGPAPAHWDAETVERVTASVERARKGVQS